VLLSIKGPNGGYRLARPANSISMLEILEAVDGPIRGQAPFSEEKNGPLNHKLEVICKQTADQGRKQLEKVHITDLLGKKERMREERGRMSQPGSSFILPASSFPNAPSCFQRSSEHRRTRGRSPRPAGPPSRTGPGRVARLAHPSQGPRCPRQKRAAVCLHR